MRFLPADFEQLTAIPAREHLPRLRRSDFAVRDGMPEMPDGDVEKVLEDACARFGREDRLILLDREVVLCGEAPALVALFPGARRRAIVLDAAAAGDDLQLAIEGHAGEEGVAAFAEGMPDLSARSAALFSAACRDGVGQGIGCGQSLAEALIKRSAPAAGECLLTAALGAECLIAVLTQTGNGFLQFHPAWDAAAAAAASHADLRRLVAFLQESRGLSVLDLTSDPYLPECMVHALAAARNLGASPYGWQWVRLAQEPLRPLIGPRLGEGVEVLHVPGPTEILLPLFAHRMKEMFSP